MKRILSITIVILTFAIQSVAQSTFKASQLQGKWTSKDGMEMSLIFEAKTAQSGNLVAEVVATESDGGCTVDMVVSVSGTFTLTDDYIYGDLDPKSVKLKDCTIYIPGVDFSKDEMMEMGRSALIENKSVFYGICNDFKYFRIISLESNRLVIKDGNDIITFNRNTSSVR